MEYEVNMSADYYLVNKETKVKLEIMGRCVRLYSPEMVADFLRDNLNQDIQVVELNDLIDLENPEPYNYQPFTDYELEWNTLQERSIEN